MNHHAPLPLPTLAEIDARIEWLHHELAWARDLRKVAARREGRTGPAASLTSGGTGYTEVPPVGYFEGGGTTTPVITNGPVPGPAGIITKDTSSDAPQRSAEDTKANAPVPPAPSEDRPARAKAARD